MSAGESHYAMGAPVGNPDPYMAMCEARRAALTAWEAWLRTAPTETVATDELMETQAAFRRMHDLATGRAVLNNDPEWP